MAVPMWGKYFACTFTGSMFGCGLHAHVVWGYVISHTGLHDHLVELNPAVLAAAIGCDVEGIVKAIDFLCSPDPNSRSDREDGRRLIRRGQFTYYVVNHEEYSRLRNEVERRGQNRNAKRAQRARAACVLPPPPPFPADPMWMVQALARPQPDASLDQPKLLGHLGRARRGLDPRSGAQLAGFGSADRQ